MTIRRKVIRLWARAPLCCTSMTCCESILMFAALSDVRILQREQGFGQQLALRYFGWRNPSNSESLMRPSDARITIASWSTAGERGVDFSILQRKFSNRL